MPNQKEEQAEACITEARHELVLIGLLRPSLDEGLRKKAPSENKKSRNQRGNLSQQTLSHT